MTHTVSETLNLAADLIERDGWWSTVHGFTGLDGGGNCAGNAILTVSNDDAECSLPAHDALATYLRGRPDYHAIYDWNDHPGRTAAEVIEVLRAAALVEAARESAAEHAPALAEAVAHV